MPHSQTAGLTERQIQNFINDGFVRVDGAFSAALADACRAELWAEIGLSPDSPESWREPVIRAPFKSSKPFVEAANTPLLHRAYNQLVGEERWIAPLGLGTIPVRFPTAEPPTDNGWHIDTGFGASADFMDWRANIRSRGRALLMLFLLSDVGPDDAPTRIREGSHAVIARELLPYGEEGASLRHLAADGFASTEGCRVALATGSAGTVFLCHPFLVHAAQHHRGARPRFMAQPPLLPRGEFDPTLPPSPVQIAIRKACGLTF
jgi:hypothetical protein